MISKTLFSITCGVLVWILGLCLYLLSFYVPILENPELQSNIVLALDIIPSAYIGTYLFYKKSHIKPSQLGLTFAMVAVLIDVIITVPVFIIPNGGSYSAYFGDPMFYAIVVEFYFIVLFFGNYLVKTGKTKNEFKGVTHG